MPVDERVELAGIPLRNAVLTASGTFGYGTEFAPFLDLERIGGFVAWNGHRKRNAKIPGIK